MFVYFSHFAARREQILEEGFNDEDIKTCLLWQKELGWRYQKVQSLFFPSRSYIVAPGENRAPLCGDAGPCGAVNAGPGLVGGDWDDSGAVRVAWSTRRLRAEQKNRENCEQLEKSYKPRPHVSHILLDACKQVDMCWRKYNWWWLLIKSKWKRKANVSLMEYSNRLPNYSSFWLHIWRRQCDIN